jgi:lipid-A-disaccharide synthase-like uncharacterized protein
MGWIDKIIANIGAMPPEEIIWLSIGFLGQFLFAMRFIIQWIVSEKKRDSVIPIAFWYFSIGGGAILKHGTSVYGLATAASIWNAGAIGLATGMGRFNIAIVLCVINLLSLLLLRRVDSADPDKRPDEDESGDGC